MRVLQRWIEPERGCSYLRDRRARTETLLATDVTPEELEAFLLHGWRRFGPIYFRPACEDCNECVSIRIAVDRFAPSRTQRRVAKNAARFRREVSVPLVDEARLALHHKWHEARERARGWEPNPIGEEEYALQLAFPHEAAREIRYFDGERLIGIGLWDRTPTALSAVFFFSDPDYARDSLGVANVLHGIDEARREGLPHVYLGYRVAGCASLAYKGSYRPHELLRERPGMREAPQWSEPSNPSSSETSNSS